ncbi:hypothetical protein QE381_003153 [Microbacterium sp. SORGH_AS 888]|nr:hypothetical protein [Microbacterium sp. SORGH_AS_0888]
MTLATLVEFQFEFFGVEPVDVAVFVGVVDVVVFAGLVPGVGSQASVGIEVGAVTHNR